MVYCIIEEFTVGIDFKEKERGGGVGLIEMKQLLGRERDITS